MTAPDVAKVAADAHVQVANKVFRDCGFSLAAMQLKRPLDALIGLKRFNGLSADAKVPFAWSYFPNAYMRDNWQQYYGLAVREHLKGGVNAPD